MTFSEALIHLKTGHRLARKGWNGRGMFIILVPGTPSAALKPGTPYDKAMRGNRASVDIEPHIDMFTARGTFQPGWLASQTDLLATDWGIV